MKSTKVFRNIQFGVKNLLLQKLQSSLTILGIVFGIASVVAMLSIGEGASQQALEQIRRLGSTNILLNAQKVGGDSAADKMRHGPSTTVYGLLYDDVDRIRESFSKVQRVAPVKAMLKKGHLHTRNEELRVVGTTVAWFDLVQRHVIAGRMLTQHDLDTRANVAVLTEYGARKLLVTENTIGQNVRLDNDYFEIVGIVQSAGGIVGGDIQTPDQEVDTYIPITTARERFGDLQQFTIAGQQMREQVELHQVIVQVEDNEDVQGTADGIGRMLARFHKKDDYKLHVPLTLLRQAEAQKKTFNIVLGSIAAISLLVGGIGIMNIMLASVTERTQEIGVRRAMGAKRKQIIEQFLIETVVLSTIGGIMGILVGIAIPWFVTRFSGMPTLITTYSLTLSVVISISIGIIFGLYPAVRAANLDPIEALRHE
jgi:putative ABC transport system permease protein